MSFSLEALSNPVSNFRIRAPTNPSTFYGTSPAWSSNNKLSPYQCIDYTAYPLEDKHKHTTRHPCMVTFT